MNVFLLVVACVIMINAFLCLYRGVKGPRIQDRLIAINIVNTKTLVVLMIVFVVTGHPKIYLDVALVYALLNFIVTVGLSRYVEAGREVIG